MNKRNRKAERPVQAVQYQVPAPVPSVPYTPFPSQLPSTYRSTSATVMGNGDATVAQVGYSLQAGDPHDPYLPPKTFTGSGASKRERGDDHDPVTGELLAVARAYQELSARLFREARGRVKAQDSERKQREHRRTREQREQFRKDREAQEKLLNQLVGPHQATLIDELTDPELLGVFHGKAVDYTVPVEGGPGKPTVISLEDVKKYARNSPSRAFTGDNPVEKKD
jgi:Rv2632c-like